jgi:tetratricopeptide (TPR) repeat protein
MKGSFAFAALACFALATAAVRAQVAPRDLWPQATAAAREGDFDAATKKTAELLNTGRSYGLRTFPEYASSASGLASASAKDNPELAKWATQAASQLDGRSSAVAFSEADRAAARNDWPRALRLATQGYARVFGDYRTSVLGRSDLLLMLILAVAVTAIVFALALFFRYGRAMAHDFREILSNRLHGGSVTVLAFALLFLPVFLWLGPIWLVFYWFAIFFGYANGGERIAIAVLLVLIALLPIASYAAADWIAGVDSPAVMAAISSATQSYEPDALRRVEELLLAVPDNATLHLLVGNLLLFEGAEDQAALHYRRATELKKGYAGAHVNLGNLHFSNNEFQAAMTEYERAEQADPSLAVAYFNHSVAAGETYKFDLQSQMLEKARKIDAGYVEEMTRNKTQKVVNYNPSIAEAWKVTRDIADASPGARTLFGNYSAFELVHSATNSITIGALLALLLATILWSLRRGVGFANACIKCGRTFCYRCKSARESATYCTQCIHIYLKRDGVSLDTKRQKLEEVTEHQTATVRRNRIFATFLPGSAQLLEGRIVAGVIGIFLFALFAGIALFVGHLAPALGPVAHVAQLLIRIVAIAVAVIIWLLMSLPVYRRRYAV